MDGMLTFTSDEFIALSRAIDAAMDRSDVDEASRLPSTPSAKPATGPALTATRKLTR